MVTLRHTLADPSATTNSSMMLAFNPPLDNLQSPGKSLRVYTGLVCLWGIISVKVTDAGWPSLQQTVLFPTLAGILRAHSK